MEAKRVSTHDELSETGCFKLQAAYNVGTQRIVQHFSRFLSPLTERDPRITVNFCAADFCVEVHSERVTNPRSSYGGKPLANFTGLKGVHS